MLDNILASLPDEEFIIADGFDEAVIGVDTSSMRLIYSVNKCIEILKREMTEDEAIDRMSFKISGAYVGEKTPIWCEEFFD